MSSAVDAYEDLWTLVVIAEANLDEARKAHDRQLAELAQHEEAIHEHIASAHERGEEPNEGELDRLHAAARAAGEHVTVRMVVYGAGQTEPKLVDTRAAARVEGCERALENARHELRTFVDEHEHEIAAERSASRGKAVAVLAQRAQAAVVEATRAWQEERAWRARMLAVVDKQADMMGEPDPPFQGFAPLSAEQLAGPWGLR